ncbi:C6 zinc finger domain protein [Penicillium brasilianum]|uniref:C6 zinc finger domain protein n=1 Tax=Penicillium brasilianum TaxID=104259 RepID=A0A1S9RMG4_PENBI|nr:C6 zinc finger domain protein [Penicillium brasilianum]
MVGVPHSSGCATCVKRRIKCDERLPGCAKCEKYGTACPGYDRGFKFITGKPYRTPRQKPKPDTSSTSEERAKTESLITGSRFQASLQAFVLKEQPWSLTYGDINVMQSIEALIQDFSQPALPTQKHIVSQWFGFLPSVYGHNQTLDASIKSFTAHHFGKALQNGQMIAYARSAYGEALYRLRKALKDPSEYLSSHVFYSVVLLCMYELFTDTEDPESWMKHAKGLGQLVKIRGPERYRNDLDITLLKVSRGLIVMQSMFSGEPCFLATEEWHQMMRQQRALDISLELHNSIEQFFAYFTYAPSLVHKFYHLKHTDITTPEALQIISATMEQALDMQKKLSLWYEQFSQIAPPPVENLASTDDPLYPIILTYSNITDATIYCGYYAYMAIIHEVLRTFGYPGPHAQMVIYFRDQICRSVEYSSVGVLGPNRLGFPLRIAIEVADSATRSWILARLDQFSKVYAASQPKNYEPILTSNI